MKRVLAVISCLFILILTSCNSNQNKWNENMNNETVSNGVSTAAESDTPKSTDTSNNTIFYFDNENIEIEAKTKDGKLPDIIQLNFDVNETQKAAFIKTYLQEKGIYKEAPDGVSYYDGKSVAEYYMDKEKRMICFVFHTLDDMTTNGVFCVTLNLDDMKNIGNLTYRSDEEKDTVYESLYDTNGRQAADITYRYIPGVPFPLITEYEDLDSYKESIGDVLFRSQKFWLYEKMAKFDEFGKLITYDGDIYQPDSINSQSVCTYDKSGKLEKIEGSLSQSDIEKYFDKEILTEHNNADKSEIKLSYQENGKLDTVNYQRSPWIYGTTGQTGEIHYDAEGRMIYEDSYITHGTIYKFYLYNDDEINPWACISIDSMPYSESEKDGIKYEYGNYYSIYLFQPS